MNGKSPLHVLNGIGPKTEAAFKKAGIMTVEQLVWTFPRGYDTYSPVITVEEGRTLEDGERAAFCLRVDAPLANRHVGRMSITAGQGSDITGRLRMTWFHMPYLKNSIHAGDTYVFCGQIKHTGQQLLIEQPAVFAVSAYEKLTETPQPVYLLPAGLTNKLMVKAVRQALDGLELSADYLPEDIRREYSLAEFHYALEKIHFPGNLEELSIARKRLAFDEFFLFFLGIKQMKENQEKAVTPYRIGHSQAADRLIASLPYRLTGAQQRVWAEIEADLQRPRAMARLVQGDVGSGKTILAFLALFSAADQGYQGALMAPTEVLARQHYQAACRYAADCGLNTQIVLLTGSMKTKERREALELIRNGEAGVIIGTHALIQEKVEYHRLAVVITDEQHRFGVRQRETLSNKGIIPHTIVMSATPIPRTLAVILYGDLDISAVDELPAHRLPIKNCVVDTSYRKTAYRFIEKQVAEGRQAYVICPMVEESEAIDAENVLDYTEKLRNALPPSITVEYLHGRMKAEEKNTVMERFLNREIQVLVSTTVVEVGVNVPNATVMMIENAERFGLAQLHQLRGRVGRGDEQSYCIMVQGKKSRETRERLDILNHSNDGFAIARKDLELRGPGDLFGVRQSGMIEFQVADVFTDAPVLAIASKAADELLKNDPKLAQREHVPLREKLKTYTKSGVFANNSCNIL